MSRVARIYSRLSPRLSNRPESRLFTKLHARLMRMSGGRLRRFLGADVLVLRTTGRRSGQPRETPLMYVRHGDAFVVVASNAAAKKTPAWWLNLQDGPDGDVLADGRWLPVRAREASADEAAAVWPALSEMYEGYDHYAEISGRRFPVVMLEPRR
jgi:F420H(2)-dependent quinone reductase